MTETTDAKKDYFDYLENVLGIKSIIDASMNSALTETELLICVENYKTYTADEIDLLQKMIAAVKVDPSRLMIVDLEQRSQIQKKVCVIFKDELGSYEPGAELTVQTFSPRVLMRKPELKKIAWAELQKVLQFFA